MPASHIYLPPNVAYSHHPSPLYLPATQPSCPLPSHLSLLPFSQLTPYCPSSHAKVRRPLWRKGLKTILSEAYEGPGSSYPPGMGPIVSSADAPPPVRYSPVVTPCNSVVPFYPPYPLHIPRWRWSLGLWRTSMRPSKLTSPEGCLPGEGPGRQDCVSWLMVSWSKVGHWHAFSSKGSKGFTPELNTMS